MNKRHHPLVGLAVLALALLAVAMPVRAGAPDAWPLFQISIPTRTPTPGGAPPPDPPPSPSPGGETPAPTTAPGSTNTPAAGSTAPPPPGGPTATRPLSLPTAGPCGDPPTLQARSLTNVRGGPGTDYPITGSLVTAQVQPITGRAANAEWWVIELPDGSLGWVVNSAVNVYGYTGAVPVVDPPALAGRTPTPGPAWNPTPNPACPTYTPTPPASATATAGATATAALAQATLPATAAPTDTVAPDTPTPPRPDATATLPVVGVSPTEPLPPPTLPADDDQAWVIYAGLALVIGGALAFVLLGRRGD